VAVHDADALAVTPTDGPPPPLIRFDPEPANEPRWRSVSVIAQDPSVEVEGRVLRARATIPFERLEPGPRGLRFHVVDYDPVVRRLRPAALLEPDAIAEASRHELESDPRVRAQQVYAVAARTLAMWEEALGRRLGWSFGSHQLYLVPAAFEDADAYYDPDTEALLFGYFPSQESAGDTVYTALSHDVVAHETTHAILDGLRHRFQEPSLPDQAAFHEALADVVALLSVFALPDVVAGLLGRPDGQGRVPALDVEPATLARHALFGLAEQVGVATTAHRGSALRRSIELEPDPGLLDDPSYEEAHARAEILVAAVARTLVGIWAGRLDGLHRRGESVDRKRAAEEGAKSADHLLTMCIRAIDYTPPVDFAFGDFLAALIASDTELAPDDEHGYRISLTDTFASYGISAEPVASVPASRGRRGLSYANLHVEELRSRRDEVYRFLWENAEYLELPIGYYLSVEDVQPCTRVGPDGFVVREVVVTYIQMLEGSVAELTALAAATGADLATPPGVDVNATLQMLGGGALIFDEYGRAKYHHRKPLLDWHRQSRRLAYLAHHGLHDSRGRFGFSEGTPVGQGFAQLHESGDPRETW